MSYIECPQCGAKALSVATRCPRCGYNYPSQPIWKQASRPDFDRFRPLLPIVGVLVAGVVLVVAIARLAGPGPAAPPVASAPVQPAPMDSAPVATPPVVPTPMAAETVTPAPARQAARGMRRYARTWVNVREDRSLGAAAVRVLSPGEAVMVDSLRRGWYRVLADDHTLGYVHRSNLGAVPPTARP
jgi:hypothetical protein